MNFGCFWLILFGHATHCKGVKRHDQVFTWGFKPIGYCKFSNQLNKSNPEL